MSLKYAAKCTEMYVGRVKQSFAVGNRGSALRNFLLVRPVPLSEESANIHEASGHYSCQVAWKLDCPLQTSELIRVVAEPPCRHLLRSGATLSTLVCVALGTEPLQKKLMRDACLGSYA